MMSEKKTFWYEEEKQLVSKTFEGASLLDLLRQWLKTGKVNHEVIQQQFQKNLLKPELIQKTNTIISSKKPNHFLLIPFILALIGQLIVKQGAPLGFLGVIFFAIAIILLVYFGLKGLLSISAIPKSKFTKDDMLFRLFPFIFGVIAMVAAFLLFNNNMFSFLNISLWILTLVCFLFSFWQSDESKITLSERWIDWKKKNLPIDFTPWHGILLFSSILIIFFRFYQLNTVLPEMISDHAEKLLDVMDILKGDTHIFFTRNTGREPFQFYLIVLVAKLFNTGITFLSMKIGTAFFGTIMCIYVYLLGKELGNKWIGLFAALLTGFSFWGNVLSRVALRFILYPAFVAPVLYYFIRGIRTGKRNNFILAGIALGIGLNGYSPIRILPILIVIGLIIYLSHRVSKGNRYQTIIGLMFVSLFSFILFLPLARFFVENPDIFLHRQATRMTGMETAINGSSWMIFLQNVFDGFLMFNWDAGEIWVNCIPHQPLLDFISAAFFIIGLFLVIIRYLKSHNWIDLFLLVALPILMLPSTLSIAYPAENPAPNRAGGAMVVVFYFAALGLYTFLKICLTKFKKNAKLWTTIISIVLLSIVAIINYNLMFNQHTTMYRNNAWNTSEMGMVINDYLVQGVKAGDVHVIAYPHWVDGRLVGFNANLPGLDLSLNPEILPSLVHNENKQIFLLKPNHSYALELLQNLFPDGEVHIFESQLIHKDFYIFVTPK